MSDLLAAPVTDAELEDLRDRVRRTRRVPVPARDDPARGLPGDLLDRLLDRWAHGYDWREHEARVRRLPWQTVGTGDRELRLVHQRAADPDAPAVVLLHGWPDSVLRFERVLPLLRDLNVLVPALPGYPFAAPVLDPGMSANRMADIIASAIDELGYRRVVVSAGDVGISVAEILAGDRPDLVAALHLMGVSPRHGAMIDPDTLAEDARSYLRVSADWVRTEGGYLAEQGTRPNTIAAALGDSPAGLLAWIGEKLIDWSDTDDGVESVWTLDELLTWVSAYWFSGAIATSFSTYVTPSALPERIGVPTVISAFQDLIPAPRSFVEAVADRSEYIPHDRGGHFAAWERPEEYAADLRRAVDLGAERDR